MKYKKIDFDIKEFDQDAFYANAKRNGDCLEWNRFLNHKGYGSFYCFGSHFMAHRISFYLINGPFDSNLMVLHKCDNPSCINPEHLFLGTAKDNFDDMIQKGRGSLDRSTVHMKGLSQKSRMKRNPFIGAFRKRSRWRAMAGRNGKQIHLGMFDTQQEAHEAYMKFINGVA